MLVSAGRAGHDGRDGPGPGCAGPGSGCVRREGARPAGHGAAEGDLQVRNLTSLVDLAVARAAGPDDAVMVPARKVGRRVFELLWRHAVPYSGAAGGEGYLRHSTLDPQRQPDLVVKVERFRRAHRLPAGVTPGRARALAPAGRCGRSRGGGPIPPRLRLARRGRCRRRVAATMRSMAWDSPTTTSAVPAAGTRSTCTTRSAAGSASVAWPTSASTRSSSWVDDGCPSCVMLSRRPDGNKGLSKSGAIAVLESLRKAR